MKLRGIDSVTNVWYEDAAKARASVRTWLIFTLKAKGMYEQLQRTAAEAELKLAEQKEWDDKAAEYKLTIGALMQLVEKRAKAKVSYQKKHLLLEDLIAISIQQSQMSLSLAKKGKEEKRKPPKSEAKVEIPQPSAEEIGSAKARDAEIAATSEMMKRFQDMTLKPASLEGQLAGAKAQGLAILRTHNKDVNKAVEALKNDLVSATEEKVILDIFDRMRHLVVATWYLTPIEQKPCKEADLVAFATSRALELYSELKAAWQPSLAV